MNGHDLTQRGHLTTYETTRRIHVKWVQLFGIFACFSPYFFEHRYTPRLENLTHHKFINFIQHMAYIFITKSTD